MGSFFLSQRTLKKHVRSCKHYTDKTVKILDSSKWDRTIILRIGSNRVGQNPTRGFGCFTKTRSIQGISKKVTGQFEVHMDEIQKLKQRWSTEQVILLCGSNRGLKDCIWPSGYVITVPDGNKTVVTGHAAENQLDKRASSTWQELLAQLAIAYWVQHLLQVLGIPGWPLRIILVTDKLN